METRTQAKAKVFSFPHVASSLPCHQFLPLYICTGSSCVGTEWMEGKDHKLKITKSLQLRVFGLKGFTWGSFKNRKGCKKGGYDRSQTLIRRRPSAVSSCKVQLWFAKPQGDKPLPQESFSWLLKQVMSLSYGPLVSCSFLIILIDLNYWLEWLFWLNIWLLHFPGSVTVAGTYLLIAAVS